MSDEDAFLAVLKANPADDTTRLVFADWLDEHGEAVKAQYLRAVVDLTRFVGGTAEYAEAAVRLYTAATQTDPDWRDAVGSRFDVFLHHYAPGAKIQLVISIREQTGFGLAEAKAMVESVPTPLFSWLTFERALYRIVAFRPRMPIDEQHFLASIRPTASLDGPVQGAVFDVLLGAINPEGHPLDDYRVNSAIRGIAGLLGITLEEARERVTRLPLTLATSLPPAEVAGYVQRVQRVCNVYRVLPQGAIHVVPRLPTQEVSSHE
jgi:uncharacterized protein (TIGR02996 family)